MAPGEADWPALALVNTRVSGTRGVLDRLAGPDDLLVWLARQNLPTGGRVDADEFVTFTGLRDAAREVLSSVELRRPPARSAISRINRLASEPVRPVLGLDRTLRWEPVGTPAAEAAVARDVIRLASSDVALRLRTCAADDCDRMFIQDHGRRVWCSVQCGNRMRVRRHATRHRTRPTDLA